MSAVLAPLSRKHELYLNSTASITVFGGAAGAGKSFLGMMDLLKHIQHPKFRACVVRRSTPQLEAPGGIIQKGNEIFPLLDPKVQYKSKQGKWVFSTGAEVYHRHFQDINAKLNFDGFEVNEFLLDEGQQFELDMVQYLMSRMRNPGCPEVQPHMKITCNPLKTSYLRDWVDWYLFHDGEFAGRPDPSKDGVLRYFIMADGKFVFRDSVEQLKKEYGNKIKPLSFTFISANVYDNPVTCENNPDYVSWLEGLKRVERERLLEGNWNAVEETTGYFKREWCEIIPQRPTNLKLKRCRAWDFAGSLPSEANPSPDFTAGVLMSRDEYGTYYIEDVQRFRGRPAEVHESVMTTAVHDGTDVRVSIPREPGQAGIAQSQLYVRELAEAGYSARAKTTSTSKVTRFSPFAAMAESGQVKLVAGMWNDVYLDELEGFDGSRAVKDD